MKRQKSTSEEVAQRVKLEKSSGRESTGAMDSGDDGETSSCVEVLRQLTIYNIRFQGVEFES